MDSRLGIMGISNIDVNYFKPINSEDVDGIISKFKKRKDVEIYHNDT